MYSHCLPPWLSLRVLVIWISWSTQSIMTLWRMFDPLPMSILYVVLKLASRVTLH